MPTARAPAAGARLAALERLASRHPAASRLAAASVVYVLAIGLSFHGVLAHPGSRIIYGLADGTSTLRDYWAASVQHRTPFTFTHDALNGAPQGFLRVPATLLANGAVQAAFVWGLTGTLGAVAAWNAFMLLGLLATGIAMYALLRRLGCSFAAALLGGYVFAFSPYDLERAYAGHLALLQNWLFVLLAYLLLRWRERGARGFALAAGATIALAFYQSAYQGLLAAFMTLVFFTVEAVRRHGARPRLRAVAAAVLAYAVSLVAMTPIFVLYVKEQSSVNETAAHAASQFSRFAATLSGYLVPSPRNPLFHWVSGFHGPLTEDTLFFGYVTLVLAVAAVVLLVRGDAWLTGSEPRRFTAVFLAVLAPAAFLMSLAPHYRVGPVSIPMPSATLGLFTTFWRVYSRFGLLVGFAIVALAALALTSLARRGGRWRFLTPAVAIVVFLEILPGNIPTFNTSAEPAWVSWLAHQPRGIVATFPWYFSGELQQDDWYQTFDGDPQFAIFGASPDQKTTRDFAIRLLTRDIWRPITAGVLATEDVRYIVVHEDAYRAIGQGTQIPDRRQYRLIKVFGPVRIYSVIAPKVDIDRALRDNAGSLAILTDLVSSLGYGGGFNAAEQFDGLPSRWMIQDGRLELALSAPAEVTLRGVAFANQQPRLLELTDASGRVLARRLIPTYAVKLTLGPLALPAGQTTLSLVAAPGPEPLGPADPRMASVFLEPFRVTALPGYIADDGSN